MNADTSPDRPWYADMVLPTLVLWTPAVVSAALPAWEHRPEASTVLLRVAYALAISIWVSADARKRRQSLPYDFDAFLLFAWPVVGPFYLWKTRRWRAGLTLLWFVLLLLTASIGDFVRMLQA